VQLEGYVKFLVSMSSLAAVAGYFIAPFFLRLLYGEVYASGPWSAIGSFRWLALGYLFALVSPVLIVGEWSRKGDGAHAHRNGISWLNLSGNAWRSQVRRRRRGDGAVLLRGVRVRCAVRQICGPARCAIERRVGGLSRPAALLGVALWLLADWPVWQFAIACAWAPATLFAIMQLPHKRPVVRALP